VREGERVRGKRGKRGGKNKGEKKGGSVASSPGAAGLCFGSPGAGVGGAVSLPQDQHLLSAKNRVSLDVFLHLSLDVYLHVCRFLAYHGAKVRTQKLALTHN